MTPVGILFRQLIKMTKVKILISGDYGSGWYSTNRQYPECLTDIEIIDLVEKRNQIKPKTLYKENNYPVENPERIKITEEIEAIAYKKYPNGYWGGATNLIVEEYNKGDLIKIHEYDGLETVKQIYYDDAVVIL
jgi:hypothetical protein